MPVRALILALSVATLTLIAGSPSRSVYAQTFNVTTTGDPSAVDGSGSLRDAIQRANENGSTDQINIPSGTYVIEIEGGAEQENAAGDFDILDSLTIQGEGPGITIVDAQQLERVFDVPVADLNVTLRGMTIRNGLASSHGGGIRTLSSLTLENVTVANNRTTSDFGGGLVQQGGDLAATDVVFTGNQSSLSGGGISTYVGVGNTQITRGTFSGNSSGNGGGLNITGDAVLRQLTVTGNSAAFSGGGIGAGGGQQVTQRIEDSVIGGNSAGNRSGGIESAATTLTIERTAIVNNTAGVRGGGMTVFGTFKGTNVTISGNSAGDNGGGIYNGDVFGGRTELVHATIVNNTADSNGDDVGDGGGVYNAPESNFAAVKGFEIRGTIIANNSDPSSDPDCWGKITSKGSNLVETISDGCNFNPGGTDITAVDPMLSSLVGTTSPIHVPLAGSPAIDAASSCPPPNVDQTGTGRPFGLKCEIGAVESAGALIWGDHNCDGAPDELDALNGLLSDLSLPPVGDAPTGCPEIGQSLGQRTWGDVDCSGEIDGADAIPVLRFAAPFDAPERGSCPLAGDPLVVTLA